MTGLDLHSTDTAHHVAVRGNLDLAGANAVRAPLLAALTAAPRQTIIDLAQVPLLTSAGIRVIVEAAKIVRAGGAQLVLRNAQEFVADTLVISGLDALIVIESRPAPPA